MVGGKDTASVRYTVVTHGCATFWRQMVLDAWHIDFTDSTGSPGRSLPSPTRADVQPVLRAAMLLLIGHWYAHRESVVVGTISGPVQDGVEALLFPYRVFA